MKYLYFKYLAFSAFLFLYAPHIIGSTITGSLPVQASILPVCLTATATTLSFVNYTPSTQNTAQATITITCLLGTTYTLALNAGTTSGGTISQRLLSDGSGHTLQYNIYTNSNHTTLWGDGTTGSTVAGSGALLPQTYTAYGVMPSGQTLNSMSVLFTDTVTITVNF